jgi:hypothetical protein
VHAPPDAAVAKGAHRLLLEDRQQPAKRANTGSTQAVAMQAAGSEPVVFQRIERLEEQLARFQATLGGVEGGLTHLRGKFDAWDVTVQRMQDYQRQQAMLAEELRKLKKVTGTDASPGEAAAQPAANQVASSSDPLCSSCKQRVAYDMQLNRLRGALVGEGTKLDLGDMFTIPGGRVKANSPLKKMVQCDSCIEKGALKLVVCTSGGAGNRLACDWCRCRMSTNTTDAASMWCGKKHSNCRTLVIENETDRQGNTLFLSKGLAPVKDVVPWDDVKLIDVGLDSYNDADYAIVASSALGKALIILEIDNMSHAAGAQYTPESERKKNDGNFAAGAGFDRVLFIRVNPSGRHSVADNQTPNLDKKARWLVVRDWIVTFLRAPYGTWTYGEKTLCYLFYDCNSQLIDARPDAFTTVVAYRAPALPLPALPDVADWACSMDPYLLIKGSKYAQECLALDGRVEQPPRPSP